MQKFLSPSIHNCLIYSSKELQLISSSMAATSTISCLNSAPPSSLPLQDRVAIVTGSSRGIGKAMAIHLASLGAKLVINYVSNKNLADDVANEINSSWNVSDEKPRAIVVQADVSEPEHVKLLFDEAERVFGSQVHVLLNNAGIANPCFIADTEVDDFDRTFSVNCRGAFLCCKEAAKRVKRGGGGRIILVSSVGMKLLPPKSATYLATKAATEIMTKILAKELKGTNITVNCVAPGAVATEMLFANFGEAELKQLAGMCPFGRLGETHDIAPLVGFLASDASEWVNGQVIGVNGGLA